jgi:hypothetical protein
MLERLLKTLVVAAVLGLCIFQGGCTNIEAWDGEPATHGFSVRSRGL